MSLAKIETELEKLSAQELRRLALKSWSAFVQKEGRGDSINECEEDDPELLAALDEAIVASKASSRRGYSASDLRKRLRGWISK